MTFKYENQKYKQGYINIIGCDEVGRGCLAGPVVAAAVVFPMTALNDKLKVKSYKVIKDSKLLSPEKREELSGFIKQNALWSIGIVSQEVVDEINIHNATLLAMKKAVEKLMSAYSHELALANVVQARGLPQSKKQASGLRYKDNSFYTSTANL